MRPVPTLLQLSTAVVLLAPAISSEIPVETPGEMLDTEGEDDIADVLFDSDPNPRTTAGDTPEDVPHTRITLAAALSDPNPNVRKAALYGLARIGHYDTEALGWRIETMLNDPDGGVRTAAVYALMRSAGAIDRTPQMLRALEAAALESSGETYAIMEALQDLGREVVGPALLMARLGAPGSRDRFVELVTWISPLPDEAVEDLLTLLLDPDEWVRLRAAEALSGVCDPSDRIVDALAVAASDSDWSVRAYATTPSCHVPPDVGGERVALEPDSLGDHISVP